MKIDLYNQDAEVIGKTELPDNIFNVGVNPDVLHLAVVAQRANSRDVLAHTKDRSEVRGGGIKPWRQKGTGRARHGSIRSPIWVGGGVTFGPTKDRNFSKKINKKTKRKSIFMALTSKVIDGQMMVLDSLSVEGHKTKKANEILDKLSGKMPDYKKSKSKRDSILIMTPKPLSNVRKAVGNLQFAGIINAESLNPVDILKYKYILMLKDSIPVIEKHYSVKSS